MGFHALENITSRDLLSVTLYSICSVHVNMYFSGHYHVKYPGNMIYICTDDIYHMSVLEQKMQ